eukprot:2191480-Rhodomonas_salina.1
MMTRAGPGPTGPWNRAQRLNSATLATRRVVHDGGPCELPFLSEPETLVPVASCSSCPEDSADHDVHTFPHPRDSADVVSFPAGGRDLPFPDQFSLQ